jgi:hypothetical protein
VVAAEIHVQDVGTIFQASIVDETGLPVDLSLSSLIQIWFQKPDQSVLTKTAVFATDGTNGVLNYTTILNDLDQPGNWKLQAFAEFGGRQVHSDIVKFKVIANLQ